MTFDFGIFLRKRSKGIDTITKLGGAIDSFGDYLCVDCANLFFASG